VFERRVIDSRHLSHGSSYRRQGLPVFTGEYLACGL
jgi:hypothetical protein